MAKLQQKNGKGEVLHAILVFAFAVYGEEEMDESVLLEKEDQIIKEYGYWHFYWALLFFPDRTENIEERLAQLAKDPPLPFLKKVLSSEVSPEAKVAPDDKQIKVLKQKVEREGKQRQQAEREVIQLQKEMKLRGGAIRQEDLRLVHGTDGLIRFRYTVRPSTRPSARCLLWTTWMVR